MTEQPFERQQAFLGKLNHFLETLEPHEQEWLAALVTSGEVDEDVQGYMLAPVGVPLPALGGTAGASALPAIGMDLRKSSGGASGDIAPSPLAFLFKLVAVKTPPPG